MPFIGRDWRSPGEAWVKTETLGWQRMKIIESQLSPSCHQQSPACSWPPRSDYGQHMDNHCGRRNDHTGPLVTGEPAMRANSLGSPDATSSSESSSADSSRNSSVSPSPSGSPEKNAHHIHPLAISSPYGLHSCYTAHHPGTATSCCAKYHHHHQPIMSKSLSKESLISAGNSLESRQKLMMRYNRSLSDIRNSPNCSGSREQPTTREPLQTKSDISAPRTREEVENGCVCLKPPTLMKNGQRIKFNDHDLDVVERQRSSSETTSSRAPDSDKQPNHLIDKSSCSSCSCCCCCCPGTGAQTATGSPCNFYPLKEPIGAKPAPHCRISVRTREVAMYNTISEAFYRLDFCNAIHDIRRFNYICKLLHLLITQNLTSLSGCATRVLFSMLEQVAWEVSNNKRNIHILKNLLKELRLMIEKYYCWGRPIGSSLLWQQHFETIERISQIVDGIELAPPKGEGDQTSFNDLPVEMIREILLRLNDYRDLVNSAQASPVMQIMIENQSIWQKLCKYHFTEQQLKLALENRSNYRMPASIRQKTNNVQGVKYARTVSADGRSSYRNPVNSSESSTTSATTTASMAATTTKQSKKKEGQSSATTTRQKRNQPLNDGSQTSSYVTRAIRIFDREGSSATLGTGRDCVNQDSTTATAGQRRQSRTYSQSDFNSKQEVSSSTSSANNSRSSSSRDIDWERVFHQLRKKFDLKEEYPDCLLLCRHCRCLFWKSFGHPCIKTDDIRVPSHSNNCDKPTKAPDTDNQQASRNTTAAQVERGTNDTDSRRSRGGRPSVADLSRSFSRDIENMQPSRRNSRGEPNGRPLSANLDAQLFLGRRPVSNNHLRENNNNNLPSSQRNQSSSMAGRRDEIVPKHVAISPQAFLKFFSL